jgi:hypothetical protein
MKVDPSPNLNKSIREKGGGREGERGEVKNILQF